MGLKIVLTNTDTPSPSTTKTFDELNLTLNRCALDYDTTLPAHDNRRFHPAGVDGQYLIRLGQVSRKITIKIRYQAATKIALEALYESDIQALANDAWDISIHDTITGVTFDNCNILDARGSAPLRPIGRPDQTNTVFRDYDFVFTQDGA